MISRWSPLCARAGAAATVSTAKPSAANTRLRPAVFVFMDILLGVDGSLRRWDPPGAPQRGRSGEHERLDHHRHSARGLEQGADVDEVEFLELDAVDRHDGARDAQLLPAVDADQAADVAVADEDERVPALEQAREPR